MKRAPELRALSEQHHQGLVLARRSKRAAAGIGGASVDATWRVVLERFEAELAPHFAVEERALVPALREVDERELIDRLESDHAALRAFVESGAPRTGEALARFGEALERHIRFEERELFPVAERRLSPAALARIERASQGSAG